MKIFTNIQVFWDVTPYRWVPSFRRVWVVLGCVMLEEERTALHTFYVGTVPFFFYLCCSYTNKGLRFHLNFELTLKNCYFLRTLPNLFRLFPSSLCHLIFSSFFIFIIFFLRVVQLTRKSGNIGSIGDFTLSWRCAEMFCPTVPY